MKGLLVKDFRLMRNMKNSFVLILLVAVGMSSYIQDTSFLVFYLAVIGVTFTTSTLSYDEFENGYVFLFSLPVTRKYYVMEKYLLGILLCGGGWLIGSVLSVAAGSVRGTSPVMDSIMVALMGLPTALLMISVMLPFFLKFGGEKGRIVMVVAFGLVFLIIVAGAKLAKSVHMNLDGILDKMPPIGEGTAVICVIAISAAIALLSCRISIGIMEKKEF